ncbi:ParB N-terminal domain-containing protein [Neobacillus niacini]|uniref:ParB N-terminal domain-containing protein n=1 Tax=Neobacillus niacini TaxID=86668 RepID=UPI002FFEAC3D
MKKEKDEKITTRIITIDPRELKLLELNARYMRHETFQQLVTNIKRDGRLTQIPFAAKDDDGNWEVLSGNHRVKASIEAGLDEIECMVTDDDLTEDRKKGIQLSHNAISGEDDPAVLKQIYESIEDIDFKMYAGLDDKTLELLDQVQPESIAEVNLEFQTMNIVFLPNELQRTKEIWDEIQTYIKADEVWLTRYAQYDDFLDSLEAVSTAYDVKNVATTFLIMLSVVQRHLDDLSDGWYDKEKEEATTNNWVPLSTIFNQNKIPAKSAEIIKKAVDKMVSQGDITKNNKWQSMEYLAADYLAGE